MKSLKATQRDLIIRIQTHPHWWSVKPTAPFLVAWSWWQDDEAAVVKWLQWWRWCWLLEITAIVGVVTMVTMVEVVLAVRDDSHGGGGDGGVMWCVAWWCDGDVVVMT
nr:hypothetical protein [Tanacetum cinerariifolium]